MNLILYYATASAVVVFAAFIVYVPLDAMSQVLQWAVSRAGKLFDGPARFLIDLTTIAVALLILPDIGFWRSCALFAVLWAVPRALERMRLRQAPEALAESRVM